MDLEKTQATRKARHLFPYTRSTKKTVTAIPEITRFAPCPA